MKNGKVSIICFCCCSPLCVCAINDNSAFYLLHCITQTLRYVTGCITQPVWMRCKAVFDIVSVFPVSAKQWCFLRCVCSSKLSQNCCCLRARKLISAKLLSQTPEGLHTATIHCFFLKHKKQIVTHIAFFSHHQKSQLSDSDFICTSFAVRFSFAQIVPKHYAVC